jgi:hypothetical protein
MDKKRRQKAEGRTKEELGRLDFGRLRDKILTCCRLKQGDIWEDREKGHRVGLLDARSLSDIRKLFGTKKADCLINDPLITSGPAAETQRRCSRKNRGGTSIFPGNGLRMPWRSLKLMRIFMSGWALITATISNRSPIL